MHIQSFILTTLLMQCVFVSWANVTDPVSVSGCTHKDYPFMVDIVVTDTKEHVCTGTLITKRWVLTAGDCCKGDYTEGFHTAYIARRVKEPDGVRRAVDKQFAHDDVKTHNVGLMRLQQSIMQTDNVQYVLMAGALHVHGENITDICKRSTLLGWHAPIEDLPPQLKCTSLAAISLERCARINGQSAYPEKYMCTYEEGKGACKRDLGGPLMCNRIQYGIIASTFDCDSEIKQAGTYMRVDLYRNWIKTIILKYKRKAAATIIHKCDPLIFLLITIKVFL